MTKRKKIIKISITAFIGLLFVASMVFTIVTAIRKNQSLPLKGDSSLYNNLTVVTTDDTFTGIGYIDGKFNMLGKDGSILWTTTLGDEQPISDALICNNFVILVLEGREVVTINKQTGEKISSFNMPIMAQNVVFNEKSGFLTVSGLVGSEYRFYVFSINDTPNQNGLINCRFVGRQETQFATKIISMLNLDDGRIIVTGGNSITYIIDMNANTPMLNEVFGSYYPVVSVSETQNGFASLDTKGNVTYYDKDFGVLKSIKNSCELTKAKEVFGYFVGAVKNGGVFGFDIKNSKKVFAISSSYDSTLNFTNDGFLIFDDSITLLFNIQEAKEVSFSITAYWILLILSIILFIALCILALTFIPKANDKLLNGSKNFYMALKKHRFVYLGLIPTFILIIIFYYIPIVWGLGLSFFDYTAGEKAVFVGMENFVAVIHNHYFWSSIGNMLSLLLTDIAKAIIPPILFAEMIMALKLKNLSFWIRVLLFIPGILPGVATLMVWMEGIFGNQGLINEIFINIGLPSFAQNWMFQSKTALSSLMLFGFPWIGAYLIFYGAAMGIPSSIYEAAKIDGCGWIKRIIKLDLPLILPQIKYIFITSFIASIQNFDRIYITTQGEYNTTTPALEMFFQLFKYNQYGIASAMSVFLFLFLAIATILNFRMRSDKS
jgi:ABC-type sugar transport system permease subunit